MVTFRDIVTGLRQLNLERGKPVIVHASLSSFGEVRGGAETILGALLMTVDSLMMPTFTYKTMLTPEAGPENNGLRYGSARDANRMAEFFKPDMPADTLMGVIAETLRKRPDARRSGHPILSFSGVGVEPALQAQTFQEPLAPIGVLAEQDGWVLLLGVDQTVNTSIHYAERLAGRKQFVRWALTREGVRECPGFPGCSQGFNQAARLLDSITRKARIGQAEVRATRLQPMMEILSGYLRNTPLALLCDQPGCERCAAVRQMMEAQSEDAQRLS